VSDAIERWKFELRLAMLEYGNAIKNGDQDAIRSASERGVALVDELAEAVEREREACAKVCDEMAHSLGLFCAAAIRARSALQSPRT
jgi:hypothetical protein